MDRVSKKKKYSPPLRTNEHRLAQTPEPKIQYPQQFKSSLGISSRSEIFFSIVRVRPPTVATPRGPRGNLPCASLTIFWQVMNFIYRLLFCGGDLLPTAMAPKALEAAGERGRKEKKETKREWERVRNRQTERDKKDK